MAAPGSCWSRRKVLRLTAAAALLPAVSRADDQVFVIFRTRVLTEAKAAQQLRNAEAEVSAQLQAQIDEAEAALAEQEKALTLARPDLTAQEFEQRAANFDRRVRETRRTANERAAELKTVFLQAHEQLKRTIVPLIAQVREESGARIILNADDLVITVDPALDLTDRLIQLVDAALPEAPLPEIDVSAPVLAPEQPETSPGQNDTQ